MKIKQKKQLNLPQLIEYAWDNDIKNKEYPCDGFESKTVIFNSMCWAEFNNGYSYNKTDFFTIEEEVEITEETEFKSMVEVTTDDLFAVWENASISTWKSEHSKEFHAYIDGEFKCIWTQEKGLVG